MAGRNLHDEIVALETVALDRWCKGDPSGFLEISAPDVVYFDPFLERQIHGLAALTAYYESLRGKVSATHHEIIDPVVIDLGGAAALNFRFLSRNAKGDEFRWNCTEVYRRTEDGWRIVQTHWSFTARPPVGVAG